MVFMFYRSILSPLESHEGRIGRLRIKISACKNKTVMVRARFSCLAEYVALVRQLVLPPDQIPTLAYTLSEPLTHPSKERSEPSKMTLGVSR